MYQPKKSYNAPIINTTDFSLFSETFDRFLDRFMWWYMAIFVLYFGTQILIWIWR